MKIFITGASGFVGGAAARYLAASHDISAMSRSEKSDAKISALGLKPVRCDLSTVAAAHLSEVDVVLHCAAKVDDWGSEEEFERDNVEGTRRMLGAAVEAGVRRFIHIGTESAIFRGKHLRGVDESHPLALDSPYLYSRTKARAEKLVRETQGIETIVLRPRIIWGEGDLTILPRICEMQEKGAFAWIGGGVALTSTTNINNLVHAIELALTKGTPGEAYFILDDGGPVRLREFLTDYAATAGVALGSRSIPGGVARGLAAVIERAYRLLSIKTPPPLTRNAAALFSRDCILKGDKARRELGYEPPISMDEGMARCRAAPAEV